MARSDREIIGKNIKILRNAAGLSQHDFSTLVDLSKRTIANIESGKTPHKLDILDEILSFFNYDLEEIRKAEIDVPTDFRENLIKYHAKNEDLTSLLLKPPTIVFAVEYKLLKSHFLETPREIVEIKSFFESLGWKFKGPSISNVLKRRSDLVEVRRHESKANTHLYSKKSIR